VAPLRSLDAQAAVLERDVEDNLSIGLLFTLGKFRMLDLADLEAHHNHELVCPNNLIGAVDVYHVNVHGQFKGMAAELAGTGIELQVVCPGVVVSEFHTRQGLDLSKVPRLSAVLRRDFFLLAGPAVLLWFLANGYTAERAGFTFERIDPDAGVFEHVPEWTGGAPRTSK
jgi:hypothetical protein